ncbi:class I SAM-dependent methyltransferase [Cognatiyoonia sp. IB215182]|uniref:class I SAM-dependent methyltransferase n=1 Tax=Cognatiyoonia sp. IB215182 TaxID=3097353 RepID=UPI002A13B11B|nr:methyltransferase domain-containing protein [Cognatiyoonia sp. IB215182]MDX8350883.1 methyltransferase domain-containing protein [Cognatiyoonia sp. IB215182]
MKKPAAKGDAVGQKITEISNSAAQKSAVIEKAARDVVNGRVTKNFFSDVYTVSYNKDDLTKRPFLNLGPGSFRHDLWRTADKNYGDDDTAWTKMRRGIEQAPVDYYWDVYERKPLQEQDRFFKVIYCSHVIEHLFAEDAAFLFCEARRLLEPGGRIRIVCPDAGLMIRAYEAEDWSFFLHYLLVKTQRIKRPFSRYTEEQAREVCAEFLVDWVSLLTNPRNPKRLSRAECVRFLASFPSLKDAFDAASRESSRELNMDVGGHVNWFDAAKLTDMLERAGFADVCVSGYLQSSVPILRDPRYFDRTDPEMSLYVEAKA